jgi:GH24 family phage-related lysozyme (muramidase)
MADINDSSKKTTRSLMGGLMSLLRGSNKDSEVLGKNSSDSEVLGGIYKLMVQKENFNKLQHERRANYLEEEESEKARRHNEIIKALTIRRKPAPKKAKAKEPVVPGMPKAPAPRAPAPGPKAPAPGPKAPAPTAPAPTAPAPGAPGPKAPAPTAPAPTAPAPTAPAPTAPAPTAPTAPKVSDAARKQAEEQARKQAEEQTRKQVEEAARKKAAKDAEEAARKKAAKDAEEAARKKAAKDAEEAARKKAAKDAEEASRKKAAKDAEEAARKETAERLKKEEAERLKREAQERAKKAEEVKKKVEQPTAAPTPSAPTPAAPPTAVKVPPAGIPSLDATKKMIMLHEGKVNYPYKDSKGLWTIGVGHLIGDGKSLPPEYDAWKNNGGPYDKKNNKTPAMTDEQVMALFEKDFEKHRLKAEKSPGWNLANETGKSAMIDLTYNLGSWWTIFKQAGAAAAAGDFNRFAEQMKYANPETKQLSKWYQQVGKRAEKIVEMIRNGKEENTQKNTPVTIPPTVGDNINSSSRSNAEMRKQLGAATAGSQTTNNVNVAQPAVAQQKSGTVVDDSSPYSRKTKQ